MTRHRLPWSRFFWFVFSCSLLPVLFAACSKPQAEPAQPAPAGGVGVAAGAGDNAPSAAAAAPAAAEAPAPAAASPAAAAAAPAPAGTVLASQDTNWQGVVAEVTELRRK